MSGDGVRVGNRGQTAVAMIEIALWELSSVNQLYSRVQEIHRIGGPGDKP